MNRKLKVLIVSLGAVLVLAVVGILYQRAKYPAILNIEVAPSGSTITVNNKGAHEGVVRVKPGRYTVTASHKGFADYSVKVTAAKNKPAYAGIVLLSNSASTASWYAEHPADQKKAEGISSHNFDQTSQTQTQTDPFILQLPFVAPGEEFRIDYGAPIPASGGRTVIYIRLRDDSAKDDALTWIRHQGYDPAKMYIVYSHS